MKTALYYKELGDGKVRCRLCPHQCNLEPGEAGNCRVRVNHNGQLISENYGKVCSLRFDPIEKKPLYHFYPGTEILSVGSVGCNLACKFCQNWEISQTGVPEYPYLKYIPPEKVVEKATERSASSGIAFTYNEPTVWFEYMLDIAKLAKEQGLNCAMVTNGFINKNPLEELVEYVDAYNIDLKSFSDKFYKEVSSARLKPVLNTIERLKKAGKHIELTHLVITGLNDREEEFTEMMKWVVNELGPSTPFHISRYFPVYQLDNQSTSIRKMMQFYEIAQEHLTYVYLGNILTTEGQITRCPDCDEVVIERRGYSTYKTGLNKEGCCANCGKNIIKYI